MTGLDERQHRMPSHSLLREPGIGHGGIIAGVTDPGGPTELADRPLHRPHERRLPRDHPQYAAIIAAHDAALADGAAGYADPVTGLFVLTAGYLADRGRCCGRGCRHCPYLV